MIQSNHNNGKPLEAHRLSEDIDSACSTPYVSAPSSPGRGTAGYFFSAPASPMHYVLAKSPATSLEPKMTSAESLTSSGSFEFEFSSRFSPSSSAGNGSMCSADELFLNGQIRPMKLSSHLQRPQFLSPLIDLEDQDDDVIDKHEVNATRGRDLRLRNRSLHRKARSLSPLRNGEYSRESRQFVEFENTDVTNETTPSGSASSSRSSSSGRNSKKWIFLKDLLYRSKSEGRENTTTKEKFWSSVSFSVTLSKEKKLSSPSLTPSSSRDEKEKRSQNQKGSRKVTAAYGGKPANGVSKRRGGLSAHELHYTTNRAQAEEMKKKTYLPYRQGLFGCLGFSSKGYGALSGFTRTLNPVSSR